MTPKEILEGALAFYEDHDWIQDQYVQLVPADEVRQVSKLPWMIPLPLISGACLEGACMVIGAGRGSGVQARRLMKEAIAELFPERVRYPREAVHCFNDLAETTREDAMLVLKFAIRKADDGGA